MSVVQDSISNIKLINDMLLKSYQSNPNFNSGLMGYGGYALFFYYYGRFFKDQDILEVADDIIDRIITVLMRFSSTGQFSYSGGAAGLGWLLKHLQKHDFIDLENDVFTDLDNTIFNFAEWELKRGNYDYLHGAMGAYYYFLYDLEMSNNHKKVESLTATLLSIKKEYKNGYYWDYFDCVKQKVIQDTMNFGLSHGIPAILSLLSKYYKFNDTSAMKAVLVNISNLIIDKANSPLCASRYPYNSSVSENADEFSRLGWCYGDLGVSLALGEMAKNTGELIYQSEALRCLNLTLNRLPSDENTVVDAALCHGTSGIAQIYRKFYYETHEDRYLQIAEQWSKRTLDLIIPTENIPTGKTSWHSTTGYYPSYGFLEGISGVGLSLLSELNESNKGWEEALLIS